MKQLHTIYRKNNTYIPQASNTLLLLFNKIKLEEKKYNFVAVYSNAKDT